MANGEYFHVSVGNDSKNLEAVADRVSRMETWRDTVYYPRVEQDPSKALSRDELDMLLVAEGLKIRLKAKRTGVSNKLSLEERSIQVQHVIEFLRSKPEFAKYVNPACVKASKLFTTYKARCRHHLSELFFHVSSCPPDKLTYWSHKWLYENNERYKAWIDELQADNDPRLDIIINEFDGNQVIMPEWILDALIGEPATVSTLCYFIMFCLIIHLTIILLLVCKYSSLRS